MENQFDSSFTSPIINIVINYLLKMGDADISLACVLSRTLRNLELCAMSMGKSLIGIYQKNALLSC